MVDNHILIDISWMSDLPYRSPISISHIDIGSYLVTLLRRVAREVECAALQP